MPKHRDPLSERSQQIERFEREIGKADRRRKLQSVKKKLERKEKSKRPRRKKWTADDLDDWEDVDYRSFERIIPPGERERRRAVAKMAFRPAESAEEEPDTDEPAGSGLRGLVVEVNAGVCRVDLGGRILLCRPRGALKAEEQGYTNVVVVGDEVLVREDGVGGGVVESVLPRRSALVRPDVFHRHLQQVIVANADQLLIVASWREPVIWLELIDRYLIAAARSGLRPIICVSKLDLVEDEALLQETVRPYQALGYPLVLTSVRTGAGIEALRGLLRDRMTVLTGLSGVGKSSLLAAVQPGLAIRTGEVSARGEGRHTTVVARLIPLDGGGAVVDTPGIREFGLDDLPRHELAGFFPEIAAVARECRFKDCAHGDEPGCAVRAAVERGAVAASRYQSYRKIYESLAG